ncbi:unnamed protein product [Blepharisma stoltei]|uniref:Translin-associated factor X-interacting protein 1 N-terminal domain-containing protein n=1 Tax=Blepharisma stoltei TaxID=1481888 RepID=A0AAU9KGW0_9CILI|nr:unnamed protein product [Blepharisma stoltei]
MSRHKRLPDLAQADLLPFQIHKSKNRHSASSVSNQQVPIIIKPHIEHSSKHHKLASVHYDSPYRKNTSLSRARSSSALNKNDRSSTKTRVGSPQIKKNASNSSLQLKFKNSRSNKSVSHANLPHQQSQSFIEPYQPQILRTRNHGSVNVSFNTSFTSLTAPTQDSQRPANQTGISCAGAQELENKLIENLKLVSQRDSICVMSIDKFGIYQKIFAEVIERNKSYANILGKIKAAYEEWVSYSLKAGLSTTPLQQEIDEANEKIKQLMEERKVVYRKVEKLAKENAELSRSLDENEIRYTDLQEKLFIISNTNVEGVPKDESTWKYLIAENKNFVEICKQMKAEIKSFRSKEKKLLKLIMAMKKRGYPVEEVYEKDVVKKRKIEKQSDQEKPENESEEELIVSGPLKPVPKPDFIPNLKLENVQPESFSSSSSESDSVCTESEESKRS